MLVDTTVLEYTVSLLTIEYNRPQKEHYLLPSTEPNSKYYLKKYFKNSID